MTGIQMPVCLCKYYSEGNDLLPRDRIVPFLTQHSPQLLANEDDVIIGLALMRKAKEELDEYIQEFEAALRRPPETSED